MKITRRGLLGSLLASPLIAKPTSIRRTIKQFANTQHGYWATLRNQDGVDIAYTQLAMVRIVAGILQANDARFVAVSSGHEIHSICIFRDGQELVVIKHGNGLGCQTNGGDIEIKWEEKGICAIE